VRLEESLMRDDRRNHAAERMIMVAAMSVLTLYGCRARGNQMDDTQLREFGARYAAAWSSQNAASLAALYAEGGSLKVNEDAPAVGRTAITAKARGFMSAFPDMVVRMDEISREGGHVVFRWTWTGTNTGPGGTGRAVRISGYEQWTLDPDGLIVESKGHFDETEYQRQVRGGSNGE
jgi:predicted ester cyclase